MLRTTFHPRNLANLEGWWDASVASSITLNGSTVSTWADLSGKGRDATQATASRQPTYKTAQQNQRNAVYFNGANSQILRGAWPLTISSMTVFAVVSMDSTTGTVGYNRVFTQTKTTDGTATGGLQNDYAISGNYIPLLRNAKNQQWAGYINSAIQSAISITHGNWNVWQTVLNGTSLSNSLDGGSATTSTVTAITTAFHTFAIGGELSGTPPGDFYGHIGEVIAYSRALSTAEQSLVAAYLKRKWATP